MANRRNLLVGSGAAAVLAATGTSASFIFGANAAFAQQVDLAKFMAPAVPDYPEGPADAKVTVVEYMSPTCPHCKAFHDTAYPQLKAEYVDTGKIQFIVRPFMRNVLDAVVFMLAEAAGPERYKDVINTFFTTQQTWAASNTPNDAMFAIAQQLGFTKESYDAALTNQTLFTGLEAMQKQALDEFGLQGTPTFYINGKKHDGGYSFEELKAAIDPALA